ncbi:hypothetical protein [Chryseobacterium sp. YR459]|uniref:hypothetical protein n=1 Tax=Chryseobacterium sp. HR92 TaxID=3094839 RepID=UPI0006465E82|nr:hypothetical protein SFA27_00545 [Chryseobacterium sp. HR92]
MFVFVPDLDYKIAAKRKVGDSSFLVRFWKLYTIDIYGFPHFFLMETSYFFQIITKIMIENLQEKKRLLQEVYSKAGNDSSETSISGIFKYLERIFLDEFNFTLSYRTMLGYHEDIVDNNKKKKIKPLILDLYCKYIGFIDFNHYREERKINYKNDTDDTEVNVTVTKGNSLSETMSNIMIVIKNQPIFNIPQMAKNGMGIGAVILILFASFSSGKGGLKIFDQENQCMYWDGDEYKLTSCNDKNPKHQLLPVDTVRLKYFKKITRPDTLTVENGLGNSWYTKYDNVVEFFTMDGINPDNGKSLRDASRHMITKYAGKNAGALLIGE